MEVTQRLLTVEELAALIGLPPSTLRRLYRAGEIPVIKLGHRTLRFSLEDVQEALRSKGGA